LPSASKQRPQGMPGNLLIAEEVKERPKGRFSLHGGLVNKLDPKDLTGKLYTDILDLNYQY